MSSHIPTSVVNNKFANFSSIAKTLIMESNHDCKLKHICNVSCNDILQCACSVFNSIGGIIDQLTVQLNYLYLLLYGH